MAALGPHTTERLKVCVGGPRWKKLSSPETVCNFPPSSIGLIPRGSEQEVLHVGYVAPVGLRGKDPLEKKKSEAKFEYLIVQIQKAVGTLYVDTMI